MIPTDVQEFAKEWVKAWNSHKMDAILSHYAEEVEITTPMIKWSLGLENGTLKGKKKVGDYWRKALAKMPDLHFELIDITESVDSIALYYKSVMNKRSIEVMYFNEKGAVNKVVAHYT